MFLFPPLSVSTVNTVSVLVAAIFVTFCFAQIKQKLHNLLNHSYSPSYVFLHFREYHNAYARFPLSVDNA